MIRYGITPWAGKSLINMNFRCTPEDAKDIANRFDVISNRGLMKGCFRFTGIISMSQTGEFMDAMHIAIKKAQISKLEQELMEMQTMGNSSTGKVDRYTSLADLSDDFPF
jgi:hypothetical protein